MYPASSIFLDVSRLIWRAWRGQFPTGIDRACLAYTEHYRDVARAVVQFGGFTHILEKHCSHALFSLLLKPSSTFRRDLVLLLAKAILQRGKSAFTVRGLLYLNVGHTGLNRIGHARWVRRTGVRPIYCVYDLIPITHPQFAREGEPERHAERMETVLKNGTGVLTISMDSIDQLRAFAEKRRLPVPPFLCAPLGIDMSAEASAGQPQISTPYFVILGTIEGRKNHLLLLRVWRRLIEVMGKDTPKLVIIGQRGWSADEVIRALDGDELLRPHIMELGKCDDSELRIWLRHARALLFPSFVEGQGLPLVEALAMGTPVIASDLAVFRETGGEIPDYLDPLDDEAWFQAVNDYLDPHDFRRNAQLSRMRDFAPPRWDEHFAAVDRWLDELRQAK